MAGQREKQAALAQSFGPLFLHLCVVSPPVLHRWGPAFALPALLITKVVKDLELCLSHPRNLF